MKNFNKLTRLFFTISLITPLSTLAQTPPELHAPAEYKTPIAFKDALTCGINETKFKARRSHVEFNLGGHYSTTVQGPIEHSEISRASFHYQIFPAGMISKARVHVFSEPNPGYVNNKDAVLRFGQGTGYADYRFGSDSTVVSAHMQSGSLHADPWLSNYVPHAIWKSRDMPATQIQAYNQYLQTNVTHNYLYIHLLRRPYLYHVVLETCHSPEGVDPFAVNVVTVGKGDVGSRPKPLTLDEGSAKPLR